MRLGGCYVLLWLSLQRGQETVLCECRCWSRQVRSCFVRLCRMSDIYMGSVLVPAPR